MNKFQEVKGKYQRLKVNMEKMEGTAETKQELLQKIDTLETLLDHLTPEHTLTDMGISSYSEVEMPE